MGSQVAKNGGFPSQKNKTSNRAKGVPWSNAVRKSLKQWKGDNGEANALRKIADTMIDCALDPESPHYEFAIKEIGVRVDGSPKRGEESGIDPTEFLHSISDAFTALSDFKSSVEDGRREIAVQNRSVLPAEVCPQEGGYGEGVDISAVSDGSGESERQD